MADYSPALREEEVLKLPGVLPPSPQPSLSLSQNLDFPPRTRAEKKFKKNSNKKGFRGQSPFVRTHTSKNLRPLFPCGDLFFFPPSTHGSSTNSRDVRTRDTRVRLTRELVDPWQQAFVLETCGSIFLLSKLTEWNDQHVDIQQRRPRGYSLTHIYSCTYSNTPVMLVDTRQQQA